MAEAGIHIIPAGLEYDRIIKPLFKDFTVKKAYLLVQDPKKEKEEYKKQTKVVNTFIEKIKKVPIDWEEIHVNLYDFNDIFKTSYDLIHREVEAKNKVYVNLSSAPKIMQVALTLASFLNNSKGSIELYYVEPEKYYEGALINATQKLLKSGVSEADVIREIKELAAEIHEHGLAAGEARIHRFPPFPLAKLTDTELEILKILREKDLVFQKKKVQADEDRYVNSIKEMKELLDRDLKTEVPRSNVKYYLDNLVDLNLIETERYKKELRIKLTIAGSLFADTRINVK